MGPLRLVLRAIRRLFSLRLRPFTFRAAGGRTVETAACGCIALRANGQSMAGRLLTRTGKTTDERMVSLMVSAPMSVLSHLSFLVRLFAGHADGGRLPPTLGYLRSRTVTVEAGDAPGWIDGVKAVQSPLRFAVIEESIRVNRGDTGSANQAGGGQTAEPAEDLDTKNLPKGKELTKALRGRVPFFPYAAEGRRPTLCTYPRQGTAGAGRPGGTETEDPATLRPAAHRQGGNHLHPLVCV